MSFAQSVPDPIYLVLELLDAEQGQQVGCAKSDDANADERGERRCSHVGVAQAENAKHGTGDAEDEDQPPVGAYVIFWMTISVVRHT